MLSIPLWEPWVILATGICQCHMWYWWRSRTLGSWTHRLGSGKLGLCLLGRMCFLWLDWTVKQLVTDCSEWELQYDHKCWQPWKHVVIKAPEFTVEKTHVWLAFWAAGQEWAWGSISEQTRRGGAMIAAKLDLPLERAGPSPQEFSSSSHHSDVSRVEVPFCPPTARSRGSGDPTGIIWK